MIEYTSNCIFCGSINDLIMFAHRQGNDMVGWIFVCPKCRNKIAHLEIRLVYAETKKEKRYPKKFSEITIDEICEEIINIVTKHSGISKEEIRRDTCYKCFTTPLGLIEIVTSIEKKFDIEIEDTSDLRTIHELLNYVYNKLMVKEGRET